MVSLRRCLPLTSGRRDISNQRLQTCTLDRDRPEVSYIHVEMVRDHPDLCFWICWNWAVAKRSECVAEARSLERQLWWWSSLREGDVDIKDGWDCVPLFPFALHLAMDSAGRWYSWWKYSAWSGGCSVAAAGAWSAQPLSNAAGKSHATVRTEVANSAR